MRLASSDVLWRYANTGKSVPGSASPHPCSPEIELRVPRGLAHVSLTNMRY